MDVIKLLGAIVASLLPLISLIKPLEELGSLRTSRQRSRYEFVQKAAAHFGDPVLASYAHELSYIVIVDDPALTTLQRKALLSLPRREKSIAQYLKARRLLKVQVSGPVLRWKYARHQEIRYRRLLRATLWLGYMVLGVYGYCSLFNVAPLPLLEVSASIDAMRIPVAVVSVLTAPLLLFHAVKVSTAEELVARAEAVGPFLE